MRGRQNTGTAPKSKWKPSSRHFVYLILLSAYLFISSTRLLSTYLYLQFISSASIYLSKLYLHLSSAYLYLPTSQFISFTCLLSTYLPTSLFYFYLFYLHLSIQTISSISIRPLSIYHLSTYILSFWSPIIYLPLSSNYSSLFSSSSCTYLFIHPSV